MSSFFVCNHMSRPDQKLINLRPQIPSITVGNSGVVESFQNTTLRPIIKLQHDILIITTKKENTFQLAVVNASDKDNYRNLTGIWMQKHPKIKNQLIGIVLGMMTTQEQEEYLLHHQEYNRRIIQMIVNRIADTLY